MTTARRRFLGLGPGRPKRYICPSVLWQRQRNGRSGDRRSGWVGGGVDDVEVPVIVDVLATVI